jgi:dihydroorotate dehydrogenase (fumarate)
VKEFAGYEIDVPFGPAAGVLNGSNQELLVEQIRQCLRSPVGLVTFGSITWEGGPGNEPEYGVVYYHNEGTGQTVNSMGLPNIGFHAAQRLYPEMKHFADEAGKPLVPSVSPGKDEDPLEVLPRMVEGFAEAGAPAIEVNYSCPNKITGEGTREPILAFDLEQMQEIDEEVVHRAGTDITIIRKLAPYLSDKRTMIPEVAALFTEASGDVWLNLSNTIGNQHVLDEMCEPGLKVPDNLGGMSGTYTGKMACDQLKRFREVLPREIGIISCNGVINGAEVFRRVHDLGADLTGGATVYLEWEKYGVSYGETGQRIAEAYAPMLDHRTNGNS